MTKPLSTPDPKRAEKLAAFDKLLTMMNELRENCPWDKKQTLETIRHLTIEETYELSDAILDKDTKGIKEELGDILLHLLFYSRIASETQLFDIADVINGVYEKMYRRHPHVYGEIDVNNEEEVKQNWEKIKLKEGKKKTVLGGVPNSLPALVKAIRVQEKVKAVGFEWPDKSGAWDKVLEEIEELKAEKEQERKEAEFGDVLFSLINYARYENINPEEALQRTNKKFMQRFNYIEQKANEKGVELDSMTLEEMDELWNEAKSISLS